MTIDCGSFVLRPLKLSDRTSMARYANNFQIWRNVRDIFPYPYSLRDAIEFIELCRGHQPTCNFCIDLDNECIGVIGYISQKDVYRRSAEIGYWLGQPFWGRGIMTRAVQALSDHIFKHTQIVRLFAGVFEWNQPSMKVLEKAGYRFDCVFEQAIFKDGKLINEHRYSKIKPTEL